MTNRIEVNAIVLSAALFGSFWLGVAGGWWTSPEPLPESPPRVIREYYQQCQGCGEWLYTHGPPTEPIESCPLCPITPKELAEIQRRIREARDGED